MKEEREVSPWASQAKVNRILYLFSTPCTPRQVERALNINKLKMRPYLNKGLVKALNPEGRKGRFYLLTDKGRKLLDLPDTEVMDKKDWGLISWVMASPRQRLVVLRTIAIDSTRRTSEEIRIRAARLNPRLSRLSTKAILQELVDKGLAETIMNESARKRYYWISGEGMKLSNDITKLGLSPEQKNI